MKVGSQNPIPVPFRGTDDMGIAYAKVAAFRIIDQDWLGDAVYFI